MRKPSGKEPTRAMIQRFVKIRHGSGLPSNLQFQFDAEQAGFNVGDLPAAVKLEHGVYEWNFAHGVLREERNRYVYLASDT